MKNLSYRDMLEATRLTRAGELGQATALLQRLLRGDTPADHRVPNADDPTPSPHAPTAARSVLEKIKHLGSSLGLKRPPAIEPSDLVPAGGQFIAGSCSNQAGSRDYKLYIPSGYHGQAVPLVVMLHGCTQSPDDFAAGTRMNVVAEQHACFVLYPAQAASANSAKCWNWFRRSDQQRGQGEPSLIADITRKVMREYAVDRGRVYIAGISAGGAAAAIMGSTYPDLYAAIGVHSGVACGIASDLQSAFAAMREGGIPIRAPNPAGSAGKSARIVPTIVFHGDRDTTVHPRNGDGIIAHSKADLELRTSVHRGQIPQGRAYTRTVHSDETGQSVLEQWDVHDAGHAWSGGSPAGSYTDPSGPDASREMMRFFLEHRHQGAVLMDAIDA